HHTRRSRLDGQQPVERRDPVDVRVGNPEPLGDGLRRGPAHPANPGVERLGEVLERALADPANACLDRLENRQQEVPLRTGIVAAVRDVALELVRAVTALPARHRRAQHGGHRVALLHGRADRALPEIHQARSATAASASRAGAAIFSTRIAAALNSAVPERGSVASIVSWLVSTWSGKWSV